MNKRLEYNQVLSLLGYKFYKVEDGKFKTIRIVNVKNKDIVKIINENDYENKITMDPNDIIKNYIKLVSDGIMTFNIVKLNTGTEKISNDIIVCLHKAKSIDNKIQEPDVVCRQNITDLYYNYMKTNDKEVVGMCMTQKTCPANLDYRIMTACDDVEYSIGVNIYIEDTIDRILDMVPVKKINKVLNNGLKEHLKTVHLFDTGNITSHDGYCSNIKQLLEENNFQYDFDSEFNIAGLNINMDDNIILVKDETDEDYYTLKNDIINQLNNLFKINISNTIVIEYDHDIDLSELQDMNTKYLLIRDNTYRIFIVNYTENGEYRESDLEIISAKEALNNIHLFNRDKYK